MSSLFSSRDKAAVAKPGTNTSSTTRLSPRATTERTEKSSPPISLRSGVLTAPGAVSSLLGKKSPLSFQKLSPPGRSPREEVQEVERAQEDSDMEKVTAWQGDMESLEQSQMRIQADQMNLLHSQIHILTRELGDLQKHVVTLSQKMEESLAEHAQVNGAWRGELETKLQNDLQSFADNHAQQLASFNDEHHQKHAQNAEAMESSLQGALESTHGKLQEELQELRHGGAGSLKDMRRILADVTEEVDKINLALEKEHELRMAVEKKLDDMCADLRSGIELSLKESHAALKLEIAEVSGNSKDIKSAMQQAHEALKSEIDAHKEATDAKHRQVQDAMSTMNDEHNERHAQNSEKFETGLQNMLGGTHAKLQEELKVLRSGGGASLNGLQKIVTDVTQQVDNIDAAVGKEQELRMAVESRLDKMFTEQDKIISDLRKDMKVALQESHAALKLELAEHGKNSDEIKSAMEDAHAALKNEAKLAHGSLKNEMQSLSKNTEAKHKQMQDDLMKVSEEHHEKHAQNSEKLEAGLENVLGNTHAKLQEELRLLKSGGGGSLKDLQKILTDVTQQVDNLDQAVEKEHELRMSVEKRLDKMYGEQDKIIGDLKKDMKVALQESHAALRLELAEHGKSSDEIADAMREAHTALKSEMSLAHGGLKNELQSLSKNNEARHKQTQDELRKEMQSIHEEHHEKHAQNAEKLESGLQNVLGNTHAKLQDELRVLKSGGVGSLKELQTIVTDVTQQVDVLDQAVEREHELRMAVEAKLDKMFGSQEKVINDLRRDMRVALNESHASLKLELASHGANANQLKEAMDEAHAALKSESQLAHGSLKNEVQSLSRGSDSKVKPALDELRRSIHAVNAEHHEKHAINAERLEQNFQALKTAHYETQQALKTERAAREAQDQTFLEFVQDFRQQKDSSEAQLQEQLRLERVAREVQTNQLRDAFTAQHNNTLQPTADYMDLILNERKSWESAVSVLERRFEGAERSISMERKERAKDMQRLWEVFDGHTHEALSHVQMPPAPPPVRKIVPTSPRVSIRSPNSPIADVRTVPSAEIIRPVLAETIPVTERVLSYAPSVETLTAPTITRSPVSETRIIRGATTSSGGSVTFPVGPADTTERRILY